jgi:hypothetical protein
MKRLKLPLDPLNLVARWANIMAGRYRHPVYLVGSQLHSEKPRDIDLVCVIPDEEFKARYGCDDVEKWVNDYKSGMYDDSIWDWCADVSNQALHGMRFCRMQIDFKVIPASYDKIDYTGKPKVRIDTRPDDVVIEPPSYLSGNDYQSKD